MKIPDKRTVSCWIAINDAVKENEFMWFIPRRKFKNDLHHASILGGAQSFEISKENCSFYSCSVRSYNFPWLVLPLISVNGIQ